MSGGLNRLLAVAAVACAALTAVLTGAPAALACNGGTSAVNVYSECLPTGGGSKHTGGHPKSAGSTSGGSKSAGSSNGSTTGGGSTSGGQSSAPTPAPVVSKHTAHALKDAGNDKRVLYNLVHSYAPERLLRASGSSGTAAAPTAIGSAFDLGSGPTVLLIVLAGTAVLLLGGSGMRVWRGRNRT